MKPNIIFRCDSSILIGSGHLIRCRSLARELKKRSINSIFFCKELKGNFINLISSEFKVIKLKQSKYLENQNIEKYSSWLGCSQEEDAKETLLNIEKNNFKNIIGIVIDHYSIDKIWQKFILQNLKKNYLLSNFKTIVIDDLHNRKHICDVLIDQTFTSFKQIDNYSSLVPENCIKLLGPSYSLLDEIYNPLSKLAEKRKNLKRVMIYFGGNDNKNYTYSLSKIIIEDAFNNYDFDIVLNKKNKYYSEIISLTKNYDNITIQDSKNSLAGLILRSDIAIGAGGTTTWERLLLGLPSLLIPTEENQINLCKNLEKINIVKVKSPSESLEEWFKNSFKYVESNLEKFSKHSKMILDCYGTLRVCNLITSTQQPIELRDINKEDSFILFRLSNDFETRENSFNKNEITINQHLKWFDKAFSNKNCIIYIAYCKSNSPIGQIRFDIKGNNCNVNFSIEKSSRGQGLGYEIIKKGLIKLKSENFKLDNISAEVLEKNISSIKIFKKLSFKEVKSNKPEVIKFIRNF